MSNRGKIRITSYITAALAALGLFGLARSADLADYSAESAQRCSDLR